MIQIQNLTAGYHDQPVLQDLSLTIPKGAVTAIVGPNGCGKTTLLRAICHQLPQTDGEINIGGKDIACYARKELARTVAVLPQVRDVPVLTVEALVQHGRYPHLGMHRRLTAKDKTIVSQAMEQTDVKKLSQQELRELSGGQRQRSYIAMALAQDTPIILLDEPTTHLDLSRQFALLSLIRSLKAAGKTIVMVLHDLGHALQYCDHLVLLEGGKLIQAGTPATLLESGALERVFGIQIQQTQDGFLFHPQRKEG